MNFKFPLNSFFTSPAAIFATITGASLISLAAALFAETVLLLEPCRLCIYQRYPFALVAILGILGLIFRKNLGRARLILTLCAALFLANAIIATYHSGVERHWWVSVVDGCKVTFANENKEKSMLENIMSEPMGSCEDIPWADPIFGLSMANYNIPWSLILLWLCAFGTFRLRKSQSA